MSRAGSWVAVCRVADIPRLGARRVDRSAFEPGPEVAVFRADDDTVFALVDRCPHKGGPLSQGIVFGRSVACPLHNWTISLEDGLARAPDVGCAARFRVKLDGDLVLLDADELRTVGVAAAAAEA
ncbi:MAG: nitrite reductase small subunit NirD [Rubrivivax sp.]|nr:nitrite reductase small subunit NirD [Rubrivivax sp.]